MRRPSADAVASVPFTIATCCSSLDSPAHAVLLRVCGGLAIALGLLVDGLVRAAGGPCHSHHILLQQIDGDRQQYHILHQERYVAGHGGKSAGRRRPAIGHKGNNSDGPDEGCTGTESPKDAACFIPEE